MLISIEDLIKTTLTLYLKKWRSLFPYMLLSFLPTLVLTLLGVVGVYLNSYVPATSVPTAIVIVAVFAASFVFGFWVSLAMSLKIKALLLGVPEPSVKETMNLSSVFLGSAIFISVVSALIITLGTFAFIIPGLIFFVWYVFSVYAVVLDGIRGFSAMRASKELVVGRWFAIALRLLLPALLFVAVVIGANWFITLPASYLIHGSVGEIVQNVLVSAVNAVCTPLTVIAVIVLYMSAKHSLATSSDSHPQG